MTKDRQAEQPEAVAPARALALGYETTAITEEETLREKSISIFHNTSPRERYVNTPPRARTHAPKEAGGELTRSRDG